MRFLSLLLFVLLTPLVCISQNLYSRSFGNTKDYPIIFLHGGPGSSSVFFEATTAQLLADRGFFVIVYDRRGEGRSAGKDAEMDFNEAFADLKSIYKEYNLKTASLLAFSFGGLIATQFTRQHPEMVRSLLLCSSLVSQQKSYDTILSSAKAIYQSKNDTLNLDELASISRMDTNSLAYRTLVFKHASANGFFTLSTPNDRAKTIYNSYKSDTLIARYVKNEQAVSTFWRHEPDHNIDITPIIKCLRQKAIPVYALYGKQDGLYSSEQITGLKRIIGGENVKYFDNCSHTVFIDQQELFLSAVSSWLPHAR
jgi:proline iminopeptidase